MLSRLRKNLVYPVSEDITEHDLNTDIDSWTYDDREVFKGNIDPEYLDNGLNVFWLYNDYNIRVGLAEHEQKNANQFCVLWFRDTPFGTYYQQDGWSSTENTLWSKMSTCAYDDCMRKRIQTPADLFRHYPAMKNEIQLLEPEPDFKKKLFMDFDFVLYERLSTPSEHGETSQASAQAQEPVPEPEQPEQQASHHQTEVPPHPPREEQPEQLPQ